MFLFKKGGNVQLSWMRSSKLQGESDVTHANLSSEAQMRRTEKKTDGQKLVSRPMMHYSWGKHVIHFKLQR